MSNPKRQWHASKALLGGFLHMFVGGVSLTEGVCADATAWGFTSQRGRGKGNFMGEGGQRVACCLGDIAQQHPGQRALTGQPKQLVAS